MSENISLAERASGRWRSLLPMLGVGAGFLTGKHGPCPMCGGIDRWRFVDRRGSGDWHCNQCGHGSGVDLAMRVLGLDFRATALRIEEIIGETKRDEPRRQADAAAQKRAMGSLWNSGVRMSSADLAGRYLASRGIVLEAYPNCLRFVPNARYDAHSSFPAMLAQVISPDGKAAQVHRTYLDRAGGKAPTGEPRKLMPGTLPPGSAVRLGACSEVLGVAEGIETALSAGQIFGKPVWAALNAGNLERFDPPPAVKHLIIYGDNDVTHAGQASAHILAKRLSGKIQVEVAIPPEAGADWNDVLRAEARAA